jgi:hypothetical protein
MLNSTTPDRPAFQPLSDARSTKTLLQDEARLQLDGGPLTGELVQGLSAA